VQTPVVLFIIINLIKWIKRKRKKVGVLVD
jgi:hypothetical protein